MSKISFKQNLHTHTTYVDGKDTPEEMVIEAIKKGFDSLGFSEHSFMEFSEISQKLTIDAMERYIAEIKELKEKYKEKIKIFCGMELEFFSDVPTENFDYLIGSAHVVEICDKHYMVDGSVDEILSAVNGELGGNGLEFARRYYETVAQIPEKHKVDIIGHFDIVSKNIERIDYIDITDKAYINLGLEAIHSLKGKIPFFEVNTGAIARGYRTSPYPQMEFLKEFKNLGFGAVINSDCHNKHFLDCHFEESIQLLKSAGFNSKFILTENGFEEVEL